jgi:hypothetical protein
MKPLLFLVMLTWSLFCSSEPISIKVPNQDWTVNFDSPVPLNASEKKGYSGSYFFGNDERYQISLFIGEPECSGESSAYYNYKCLRSKIYNIPGLVESSISTERKNGATQLSYLVYVPNGETAIKTIHTHLLFEKNGSWGDLHVSVVKPNTEQITRLFGLVDSFSINN